MAELYSTIRAKLSVWPSVYRPIAYIISSGKVVTRNTHLVIEAYPRSGNSFAEASFRQAQDCEPELAHHCHAAAQVIQAARWDIPSLVIIRDPIEAATSLLMHRDDSYSPRRALKDYILFYRSIRPFREKFVLASFRSVTEDFGKVVNSLNCRFGTNFACPSNDVEATKAAFDRLNSISLQRGTLKGDVEPYSPELPDSEKQARREEKNRVRELFESPQLAPLCKEAKAVYADFLSSADCKTAGE